MLFLRGTRTARIKVHAIHDVPCNNCKDFDLTLVVSRDYMHIWFIPIAPAGVKTSRIYCHSCSQFMRSDSLTREYEAKTRTPFYLYAGLILIGLVGVGFAGALLWGTFLRSNYISHPQPGDVYLIKTDKPFDSYHFSRVMRVSGDSVIVWDNNVNYLSIGGSPSKLDPTDYFSADRELMYTRSGVKEMYDKDSIVNVFRGEGDGTGFNRIK